MRDMGKESVKEVADCERQAVARVARSRRCGSNRRRRADRSRHRERELFCISFVLNVIHGRHVAEDCPRYLPVRSYGNVKFIFLLLS